MEDKKLIHNGGLQDVSEVTTLEEVATVEIKGESCEVADVTVNDVISTNQDNNEIDNKNKGSNEINISQDEDTENSDDVTSNELSVTDTKDDVTDLTDSDSEKTVNKCDCSKVHKLVELNTGESVVAVITYDKNNLLISGADLFVQKNNEVYMGSKALNVRRSQIVSDTVSGIPGIDNLAISLTQKEKEVTFKNLRKVFLKNDISNYVQYSESISLEDLRRYILTDIITWCEETKNADIHEVEYKFVNSKIYNIDNYNEAYLNKELYVVSSAYIDLLLNKFGGWNKNNFYKRLIQFDRITGNHTYLGRTTTSLRNKNMSKGSDSQSCRLFYVSKDEKKRIQEGR